MLDATLRGKAVSDIEIYAPTGVLTGTPDYVPIAPDGPASDDGPDPTMPFVVADASWYPLDGAKPARAPVSSVSQDDALVVVTPPPELKVHLTSYRIALELGPYRVTGDLATHPGFDPEKSIARPSGGFIPLSDVMIELVGRPDAGVAERKHVHVNRYAVERVTAPIMLGHFFPGAQMESKQVVAHAG
jgi:hypothetical protein